LAQPFSPASVQALRCAQNALSTSAAREYAGALVDYVVAIAIKSQDPEYKTVVEFGRFENKMKAAMDVLKDYPRVYAVAACGVMAFSLHAWGRRQELFSMRTFAYATAIVSDLPEMADIPPMLSLDVPIGERRVAVIDPVTRGIVDAAWCVCRSGGQQEIARIIADLEQTNAISEFDRLKMLVVQAYGALRCGDLGAARQVLEQLEHMEWRTAQWAQARIAEIDANGA